MSKISTAVAAAVLVGILGLAAWWGVERWLTHRALAVHFAEGKEFAVRVLEEVGAVPDELRESSGVVVSRTQPGVLWSHNDSGDGPNLYAIDITGRLLARFSITNAMARDWEDISSGPCPANVAAAQPAQPSGCLYIADTGDNTEVRREVTIYIVAEPRVGGSDASPTVTARSLNFRYAEGPTDAEAIAVRPNGDITIVSKGRKGKIDFFILTADTVTRALASGETVAARYNGNTGIPPEDRTGRLATSAAVSPDGMTLAVRTYYEIYFYGLVNERGETRWRDLERPCALGDAEPQGEAIDFLDESTLLITSERARGRPGAIHRVQC
ncbi:MAG TPA: hypothetical protein VFS23_33725 [Vicinamibacterales bacterium]|nr:hypothetical protein [Vicinamibacterales bacterium]